MSVAKSRLQHLDSVSTFDTLEVITAYVVDVGGVEVPGEAAVAADQATAGRTGRRTVYSTAVYTAVIARIDVSTRVYKLFTINWLQ